MYNEIYLIGGGPSLQGFDFSTLQHKTTIAVNMSALDVPTPTFSITADSTILKRLQEGEFKNVKTTWVLVTNPDHCTMKFKDGQFKNIRTGYVYNTFVANIVIRNAGVEGLGFSFNDFRTGYNSGFCALQLAILLKYNVIHLLGFDLTGDKKKCHYHKYYKGNGISDENFNRYLMCFIEALTILKNHTHIKVISHSKISQLNDYIEYVPWVTS